MYLENTMKIPSIPKKLVRRDQKVEIAQEKQKKKKNQYRSKIPKVKT